jgi:hypothetical protein
MEIRIILDDRIVNGARRVFSRSGLAALTALTLLAGGAALVAQEASEASNVFSPGEVISSSAVNQNFQELHDLAAAQDEEIATKASEFTLGLAVSESLYKDTNGSSSASKTTVDAWDLCMISRFQLDNNGGTAFTWKLDKNEDGTWTAVIEHLSGGANVDFLSTSLSCFNLN